MPTIDITHVMIDGTMFKEREGEGCYEKTGSMLLAACWCERGRVITIDISRDRIDGVIHVRDGVEGSICQPSSDNRGVSRHVFSYGSTE